MFFYYNHLLQKPLTIQSIKGIVINCKHHKYFQFSSFMELVNQRKLVCYLFLSKLDFNRVNEEYKSLLSSQEVQVQFVQSVLRGATFMTTQFIIKSLEALPTPQNLRLVFDTFESFHWSSGSSLLIGRAFENQEKRSRRKLWIKSRSHALDIQSIL